MSGVDSHSEYMARMDIINSILELGKVHNELMTQEKQRQDYLRQPETKYKMPIKYMLDELYSNRDKVKGDKILSSLSEYAQYYDAVADTETIYSDIRKLEVVSKKISSFKDVYKLTKKRAKKLEDIIKSFKKRHTLSINDIEESVEYMIRKEFLGEEVGGDYIGSMRKIAIRNVAKYLNQTLRDLTDSHLNDKYSREQLENIFDKSLERFNPQGKEDELRKKMLTELHKLKEHIHSSHEFVEYIRSFNREINELENRMASSL